MAPSDADNDFEVRGRQRDRPTSDADEGAEDYGAEDDSESVSNDELALYADEYVPVHNLYNPKASDRRGRPQEEPPILWTTNVFDAKDEGGYATRTPAAIYHDDKPSKIVLENVKKQQIIADQRLTEPRSPKHNAPHVPISWKGCVFEVATRAIAHFPVPSRREYPPPPRNPMDKVREWRTNTGNMPAPPRTTYTYDRPRYTKFESLIFEELSLSSIIIKSPYLYEKLREIAGYYPAFISKSFYSSDRRGEQLEIEHPWSFLYHRFAEIESFVKSTAPPEIKDEGHRNNQEGYFQVQKEHMKYLYDFLKSSYNAQLEPCKHILSQPLPSLPFNMIWYAFPPGTDVYCQDRDGVFAAVVVRVFSNLEEDDSLNIKQNRVEQKYWALDLWNLETDGTSVGRIPINWRIDSFAGSRPLTSLDICPCAVWDAYDKGERRERIMKRSRIMAKMLQQGYILANHNGSANYGRRFYSGSVVIDHKRGLSSTRSLPPRFGVSDFSNEYASYNIGSKAERQQQELAPEPMVPIAPVPRDRYAFDDPNVGWSNRATVGNNTSVYERDRPVIRERVREEVIVRRRVRSRSRSISSDGSGDFGLNDNSKAKGMGDVNFTDHQLLLFSPKTYAFALKTKQWLTIQTDNVSEVESSDDSISNLVIDEAELKTIQALSTRQNSKRDIWAADFIEGKGTGQIVLLHGPPGVGKTYTVESIAALLNRPLLSLTVADIGTVETRTERELLRWFTLAEGWNAVLLVDEADIFLERRQNRDLARNGLVSAFLRRMEYFSGLLFLTTNRVGQIDDAFISRVHVAIGYKPLSAEGRSKIWQGFFKKLAKERAGKIQISTAARKWVLEKAESGQAQLNGRDIRNALQTAITLAEAECEEDPDFDSSTMVIVVDQTHFERVLDISNKFHEYVKSIRREDEKKRAAALEWRNDYWKGVTNEKA